MQPADTPIFAAELPQSPAKTLVEGLKSHMHVKVVDFAYTSRLSPVPEIFDQYAAIAEVEYRWSQKIRKYPIAGKNLFRLMYLGWISEEEVSRRGAEMDRMELQQYMSREPLYPWKPISGRMAPTPEERCVLKEQRSGQYQRLDMMRMQVEQKVKEEYKRPKQYPAPLHTYEPEDYPELHQNGQGGNSENAVPKMGGGKLRRTETLLLF